MSDPEGLRPLTLPYVPDKNIVCCVGGVMKLCMNDPDNSAYKCRAIHDAMVVHEQSHLSEYQRAAPKLCAGTAGRRYSVGYSSMEQNQLSELNAFNVQLDYLINQRKQPVCWSDDCQKEIEFMIGWILNTAIPSVIDGTYWSRQW